MSPVGPVDSLPLFRGLDVASSGLGAQRMRMEIIAENLANARTTRTAEGGPYRRKIVELAARLASEVDGDAGQSAGGGVRVTGVTTDPTEGPLVYEPGHPDANEDGYVRYPNVDLTTEMVDLMEARRLYEANASVFEAMKSMLRRAIDL